MVTFKNEKLKMGGAELSRVRYIFRNGHFYSVLVKAEKLENFNALREYLVKNHGPGNSPDKKTETYQWRGEVTSIRLFYRPQREHSILEITSTKGIKSFAEEIDRGKKGN